jgi:hypothetical protein
LILRPQEAARERLHDLDDGDGDQERGRQVVVGEAQDGATTIAMAST